MGIPVLNTRLIMLVNKFIEAYTTHDLNMANNLWWLIRYELHRERLENAKQNNKSK